MVEKVNANDVNSIWSGPLDQIRFGRLAKAEMAGALLLWTGPRAPYPNKVTRQEPDYARNTHTHTQYCANSERASLSRRGPENSCASQACVFQLSASAR